MLVIDILRFMGMILLEKDIDYDVFVKGGVFFVVRVINNFFVVGVCQGVFFGVGFDVWVVEEYKEEYDRIFKSLGLKNGKVSGVVAKREMVKLKFLNIVLGKIWILLDIDRDGQLDEDEFVVVMYLIKIKLDDDDLLDEFFFYLILLSKRLLVFNGMDYD